MPIENDTRQSTVIFQNQNYSSSTMNNPEIRVHASDAIQGNGRERLCVIMPVYNEEAAIGNVLTKWHIVLESLGIDFEIRAYNDGSKDGTLVAMQDIAGRLGRRVVVEDKINEGHGPTILRGYREAVADGFDWIFQVDSDDEMGPEKFGELWTKRFECDFLVGTRDGRRQVWSRKIVSSVSRLCVRVFYGKGVWDVNAPYRLMRTAVFKEFFERIPPDTFAPNVILSGLAARQGLRMLEIPVPQHDRATGEVSIKQWKLARAAARSFGQTVAFALDHWNVACWGLLGVLGILTILLGIPWVTQRTNVDNDVYVLGGKILAEGGRMYADFFDHKGPAMFLINEVGWKLCPGWLGVWGLETVLWITAIAVFWREARRSLGRLAALAGCLSLVVFRLDWDFADRPESFAVELAALAMGLLLGRAWKRGAAVAGAACAAVFFMKQTLISPFIGIFAFLVLWGGGKQRWGWVLWFVGSALAVSAIFTLWLVSQGVMEEYIRDCYAFNLLYQNSNRFFADGVGAKALFLSVLEVPSQLGIWAGLGLAGVAAFCTWPKKDRISKLRRALVLGWLLWVGMDTWFVARCGRIYPYQLPTLRWACVLALLPVVGLWGKFLTAYGRWGKPILLALAVMVLVPVFGPELFRGAVWTYGVLKTGNIRPVPGWDGDEICHVAQVINRLPPDHPLFVWGNAARLYLLTGRKGVIPHYYWGALGLEGFLSIEEINSLMDVLEREHPLIVDEVLNTSDGNPGSLLLNTPYDSTFKRRLKSFVETHYEAHPTDERPVLYLPKRWPATINAVTRDG